MQKVKTRKGEFIILEVPNDASDFRYNTMYDIIRDIWVEKATSELLDKSKTFTLTDIINKFNSGRNDLLVKKLDISEKDYVKNAIKK